MRRWAFVIAMLGMFVLVLFFSVGPEEVESVEGLVVNKNVLLNGIVVEERVIYEGVKVLILDSGIELVCECDESFVDRRVRVEGVVEEFDGRKQVRVLRIEVNY